MTKTEFDTLLNNNIPGSAEKVHYCMLNKIYYRTGMSDVYELALVDSDFSIVQLYRTCNIADVLGFGYSYDFMLDGNYVKCNPFVQNVVGDSLAESDIGTVLGYPRQPSIFTFIVHGCKNWYVLFDDSIMDSDKQNCPMTYFCNIRFSKSTMSVYAQMASENGIYNKMIATEEQSKLHMNSFYYGVPSNTSDSVGKFVMQKRVNGILYDVYYLEFLPVFDGIGRILPHSIINTAIQYQECCDFVINTMTDLMNYLYVIDDDKIEWVGGKRNYVSSYSITFESLMPKIKKKERLRIIDLIINGEETGYEADPRVCYLKSAMNAVEYDENNVPKLNSLNSTLMFMKSRRICYSAYIMAIRYYLYCSHESLTGGFTGSLYGGMTDFGTFVKEGIGQ